MTESTEGLKVQSPVFDSLIVFNDGVMTTFN